MAIPSTSDANVGYGNHHEVLMSHEACQFALDQLRGVLTVCEDPREPKRPNNELTLVEISTTNQECYLFSKTTRRRVVR